MVLSHFLFFKYEANASVFVPYWCAVRCSGVISTIENRIIIALSIIVLAVKRVDGSSQVPSVLNSPFPPSLAPRARGGFASTVPLISEVFVCAVVFLFVVALETHRSPSPLPFSCMMIPIECPN